MLALGNRSNTLAGADQSARRTSWYQANSDSSDSGCRSQYSRNVFLEMIRKVEKLPSSHHCLYYNAPKTLASVTRSLAELILTWGLGEG